MGEGESQTSRSLISRTKVLRDKAAQRKSRTARQTSAQTDPGAGQVRIIQLPFWPEQTRALPNDLARSALFTVQNRKQTRKHLHQAEVAAFGDIKLRYTGEQLRQDDEDVWLAIQHLARNRPIHEPVVFRPVDMVRGLGWAIKGQSYTRLKDTIVRLKATDLQVQCRVGLFGGSLIQTYAFNRDEGDIAKSNVADMLDKGYWAIWLDPQISQLFRPDTYTLIDWEQRRQLAPLAKWLHSYFKGHSEPFPIKVATIQKMCGTDAVNLFHFRDDLKRALNRLQQIGFLLAWHLDDDDKVHVRRAPRARNEHPLHIPTP